MATRKSRRQRRRTGRRQRQQQRRMTMRGGRRPPAGNNISDPEIVGETVQKISVVGKNENGHKSIVVTDVTNSNEANRFDTCDINNVENADIKTTFGEFRAAYDALKQGDNNIGLCLKGVILRDATGKRNILRDANGKAIIDFDREDVLNAADRIVFKDNGINVDETADNKNGEWVIAQP